MPEIEFHFDFLSPYGYFASRSIEELASRNGRAVSWHPMLLGVTVMKVMGLKPLLETPLKGDYVRHDIERLSRMLQLPLGRDVDQPPTSSLVPARAVCWAKQHAPHVVSELVRGLYVAIWERGIDINEPSDLLRAEFPRSIDRSALLMAAGSTEASELLRRAVEMSIAKGVFGSPTLLIDGEPFWGLDRFDQAERWLQTGGW
ncbi:hypothetical protein ASF19_00395 [Acidovorax sp. Leaf84]|uniref:2-hydroxychromene-2-carboxylate isomerase n=1 Tax=Acidovorax sp. Leaf84 TaxID=1736240 RepID=UPI0006F4CB59|nr:2-hydroxychromene-2-carboxylate isomerase [Acidovorax sp. Leaf84]KQO40158.1 hypothetical protein ASF19_00395 [Acidovorax sp. Leaf84]